MMPDYMCAWCLVRLPDEAAAAEHVRGCAQRAVWQCKARAANTGANDPQDCNWPLCGCDPHADKVIEALNESGLYVVPASGDNFELIRAGCEALKGMPHDQPEEIVLAVYEAMVERSQKS